MAETAKTEKSTENYMNNIDFEPRQGICCSCNDQNPVNLYLLPEASVAEWRCKRCAPLVGFMLKTPVLGEGMSGRDGVCEKCAGKSWVSFFADIGSVGSWLCSCCQPLDEIERAVLSEGVAIHSSSRCAPPGSDKDDPLEALICSECAATRCVNCSSLQTTVTCRLCFSSLCNLCHAHVQGLALCFSCADGMPQKAAEPIPEEEIPW